MSDGISGDQDVVHDDAHGAIIELVRQTHATIVALDEKLSGHMKDEPQQLAQVLADLMARAFPEGDLDGHKAAHRAQIKAMEDRAAFWGKMRYDLTRLGLIGFSLWALKVLIESAYTSLVQGAFK